MKTEGDEEDRPEEGIRNAVEPVLHFLNQFLVGDFLAEEQPGHVRPEDDMQADGLGQQAEGEAKDEHESETFALPVLKGVLEDGIKPFPRGDNEAKEQDHLEDDPSRANQADVFAIEHAEHEAEQEQGQQVVHHAGGHDKARHRRFLQAEVLQNLEGDHHRRRRHREADKQRRLPFEPERQAKPHAHAEGHHRTDDGHPQRTLDRLEKFPRLGGDPGVEHQEKDAHFSENINGLVGLHPVQHGGAEKHPGHQLAENRRQAHPAQQHGGGPDHDQQNQQMFENRVHEFLPGVPAVFPARNKKIIQEE